MDQDSKAQSDRLAGAEAISAKAVAIGREIGVEISKCVWDLGKDFALQHAHQLELSTETKTVRLYFPDVELTSADNGSRTRRTEERLRSAIAQLLSRPPAATYAF